MPWTVSQKCKDIDIEGR